MNRSTLSRTRVVVTGLGAITPAGQTVESFWDSLISGHSAIGPLTLADPTDFSCKVAGEVKQWDPRRFILPEAAEGMARFSQFMVAAAAQALDDAGLRIDQEDRTRIGVLVGNGGGGYRDIQEGARTLFEKGPMKIDPLYLTRTFANMAAAQVAIYFHLCGYNGTIMAACAASTQAIGQAGMIIRSGRADVMVTGGSEATLSELRLAGFSVMRALTSRNQDPAKASRPFDRGRDGFVPAEGSGCLILESEAHARRRGARIYAELGGFGCTSDAYNLVAPLEDGSGAARAMSEALRDAEVSPEAVDYVNAHATSTPIGDRAETTALKTVFGRFADRIPISATKSLIGHALAASGAMETVATVKTIETGTIHATINLEDPDPACDLDYVPNASRKCEVRVALKNSFGFGGQNSCLVFTRYEP